MKPESFVELFEEAKKRDDYWVADAIYHFTEELYQLAEKEKVSNTELARRLGTTPAYITKIFRGDVNFTIETMVRLARVLGAKLHLHLGPGEKEEQLPLVLKTNHRKRSTRIKSLSNEPKP
jgi:plasmid maintenance system antidote protein VapI